MRYDSATGHDRSPSLPEAASVPSRPPPGAALDALEVTAGYRTGRSVTPILGPVSLSMASGEFVCLLGPNGVGKSTLLRTLAGMQPPLSGVVRLDGANIQTLPRSEVARRLSVVLTDRVAFGLLTAHELVALGRHPFTDWSGRLSEHDAAVVARAIEAVGAQSLASRLVSELSDGERQKVMVARALAQEPAVMVLDEVTAFLDLPRRVEMMQLLRRLAHDRGCAVLLSTHDLDLALRHADTLWVVGPQGLAVGLPEELVLNGALATAFGGTGLSFDSHTGTFHVPRSLRGRVRVEGAEPAAHWTRCALERVGFSATSCHPLEEGEPELLVEAFARRHARVARRRRRRGLGARDLGLVDPRGAASRGDHARARGGRRHAGDRPLIVERGRLTSPNQPCVVKAWARVGLSVDAPVVKSVFLVAAAMAIGVTVAADSRPEPFAIAGRLVPVGSRLDLEIPVPASATDPATHVPVTVLHGTAPGPVLSVTAGVHAYEFPPILAAVELLSQIDPATLRGTVILVPVAHVSAFEHRVPYVNPFDRKNLSRVFPGDPAGTQSERIAWVLTTEVIRRGDMHLDIHGGDGAEWLEPFVGIYGGTLAAAQYPRSREMGLALRFRNVVKNSTNDRRALDGGRSVTRQAIADGKPTALIEIGENGRRDAAFVRPIIDGVINLLRAFRMVPGAATPPRRDTRWFDGSVNALATVSGILTPTATRSRVVRKGEPLATVRDYAGREREVVRAPVDGYVLYGLTGPPVRAGDPVANIGIVANGPL